MTQKVIVTSALVLAFVASISEAQQFQYQQQQFQPQYRQIQPQYQQFQQVQPQYQQPNPIQVQNRGSATQQPASGYTNVVMSDAEKAKPSLGASFSDTAGGISVRSTFTNSPASNAGLKSGDVLTMVNGKAIQSVASFNGMVAGLQAGDMIELAKTSSSGQKSKVKVKVMTMGDVMKSSIVPEAGVYDQAAVKAEVELKRMAQEIKNAQLDMDDLKKGYAAQEKRVADLKEQAKTARMETEKRKAAAEMAREKRIKEMKMKAEEAANR